jgi:hypothetical protein
MKKKRKRKKKEEEARGCCPRPSSSSLLSSGTGTGRTGLRGTSGCRGAWDSHAGRGPRKSDCGEQDCSKELKTHKDKKTRTCQSASDTEDTHHSYVRKF